MTIDAKERDHLQGRRRALGTLLRKVAPCAVLPTGTSHDPCAARRHFNCSANSRLGMRQEPLTRRAAFVVLALALATAAGGQTVATNFEELRFKVKAGDTVYLTDDSGKSERRARVLDLTDSLLVVSIGGARHELVENAVTRIRQRLPDSKKNGALIGFLVGGAGSTAGAVALASPAGSCRGGCVASNVLYGGGIGALVGVGVDALIQRPRDVYRAGRGRASADTVVRPMFSSHEKGFSVSFRF